MGKPEKGSGEQPDGQEGAGAERADKTRRTIEETLRSMYDWGPGDPSFDAEMVLDVEEERRRAEEELELEWELDGMNDLHPGKEESQFV